MTQSTRFSLAAAVISLLAGLFIAIFISPLLQTLFELGDYGWLFVFGVVVPLGTAFIIYVILRGIEWGLSLLRR